MAHLALLLLLLLVAGAQGDRVAPRTGTGLSTARSLVAGIVQTTIAGNSVIFVGGKNDTTALGATAAYDEFPASGGSPLASGELTEKIYGAISVLCNGAYLLIGAEMTKISRYSNGTLVSNFSMPSTRSGYAAASYGTYLLIAGGDPTPPATIDVLDCQSGTANVPLTLSAPSRISLAAAGGGSAVIFAGGSELGSPVSTVDVCTFASCNVGPPLSVARSDLAGAYSSGYYYFAGGLTDTAMTDAVDVYKVVNGMGQLVSSSVRLSSLCYGLTGLSLPSTVVFAGGAFIFNGGTTTIGLAYVDVFYTGNDIPQTLPHPSLSANRTQLCAVASSTHMFFAGGYLPDTNDFSTVVDYFPIPSSPTTAPPSTQPSPPPPPPPPSATTQSPATQFPTAPTTAPPTTAPSATCHGQPPVAGAVCTNGVWTIGSLTTDQILMTAGTTLVIQGSLTLTSSANVTMEVSGAGGSINVTGTASLSGTLVIALPSLPEHNSSVVLINAGSIRGNFTEVQAVSGERCSDVNVQQSVGAQTLTATFMVSNKCGGSSRRTAIIVSVVIASCVVLALLAIGGLLLLRRLRLTNSAFAYRAVEDYNAVR